jgi:hypothetical protein
MVPDTIPALVRRGEKWFLTPFLIPASDTIPACPFLTDTIPDTIPARSPFLPGNSWRIYEHREPSSSSVDRGGQFRYDLHRLAE